MCCIFRAPSIIHIEHMKMDPPGSPNHGLPIQVHRCAAVWYSNREGNRETRFLDTLKVVHQATELKAGANLVEHIQKGLR